ncbi:hypothetical protein [Polaromonas sp. CG9_12]|nr:hypothetical protein [Polaromonas sp. CG9_12]
MIWPKPNRKMQRGCDWGMDKERHVIECMFGKLKYFRRIATRYRKKASHFMDMLTLLRFCCGDAHASANTWFLTARNLEKRHFLLIFT